jgi:Big-like domain-containing protein
MFIVNCSLQCNDSAGNPGSQISCGVTNVRLNQEIRIEFSNPVDPTTVTNNSFQMVEQGTGKTPAGTFALDPNDARTLIYRPQLTFDSAGNPIFGLNEDSTYFFKVPGSVLDPLGPYVRDTSGSPNSSRLQCTLVASEAVLDASPGPPRATITVDTVTGYDANGQPDSFDLNVPAPGAVNVYRFSPVRIVFNDVMNPATLANPVTGQSSFIRAFVDADGDTTDRSDQIAMNGQFTVTIDQNSARTTVIFTPSGGMPSAGTAASLRKIVIELSPLIVDLGGNPLVGAGTIAFTSEQIQFDPLVISETFIDPSREDPVRTGSAWGAGFLATGPGGGSGRLGDLVVLPGTVVTLNTDSEDFTGITNPAIFNPANIIDKPANFSVDGGVFEFSRLRVDAGAVLRFEGTHAARVYVRGVVDIQGLVDVSGLSGTLQASNLPQGGTGGEPGSGGGAGGRGGSRPDGSAFSGFYQGVPIGGVANPGVGPSNVLDAATYEFVNGIPGTGIPFPDTLVPTQLVGGGGSGLGWPQPSPLNPALHMPGNLNDVVGLEPDRFQECRHPVPSAPGGGGANALDGNIGDATYTPLSPVTLPPDTPGGDSGPLLSNSALHTLSPELGLLRGGGGGGGGGAHLQRTQVNGRLIQDCSIAVPDGSARQITSYEAHSSAGGGGGGGAIQVAAGRRIILFGRIDASGGAGGSGTFPPDPATPTDLAQAGGGGAGGSVLLQSQRVQIQAVPGRIDVAGGEGGIGSGSAYPIVPSTGGHGSPGLLRIEAPIPPEVVNEKPKVSPTEVDLIQQYGPGVSVDDFFTTAVWQAAPDAPSGWSGAQSCWIRPTGNFFRLIFDEDEVGAPGWDMRLLITGQANPQSFRGPNDITPGVSLEQGFGTEFGTAPVIVRFQGARALGTLVDPCSVPEFGTSSPLSAPSLTDWVSHPAELNDFHADESLAPNIFRFIVLWDRSQVDFTGLEGVEDLTVTIQPD